MKNKSFNSSTSATNNIGAPYIRMVYIHSMVATELCDSKEICRLPLIWHTGLRPTVHAADG
jgi:hypothetical protein